MLEPRQRARFPGETGAKVGIGRALRAQHLDRDGTAEPLVARAEDAPHAAAAELRLEDERVRAQMRKRAGGRGAGGRRHARAADVREEAARTDGEAPGRVDG